MAKSHSAPIRVLTSYYRPKPGGLCKRLFRAMRALLDTGYEVHYLAVTPFPIEHPRCRFHRYPWPKNKTDGFVFWTIFHLLAPIMLLFLGIRYRITHCFAFGTSYGFMLQPLRLLKRISLTLFLRADSVQNLRLKGRASWLLKLEQTIEGLALAGSHFYGVSQHLTDTVLARHRFLQPLRSGTLPNDIKDIAPHTRTIPTLPLRIGCVGILETRKNQALAIQCMQHFDSSQAQLYLFGTGPQELALKRLAAELQIHNRVHFAGWIDSPSKIWSMIDILLFPSLHEGSPNAVLEALAAGVAVLASDIPEHREVLPAVSLLPIEDVSHWVNAVRIIVQEPGQRLEALRNLQHGTTERLRFDWERVMVQAILQTKAHSVAAGGR